MQDGLYVQSLKLPTTTIVLLLLASTRLEAMSDTDALTKARQIWGPTAYIAKLRPTPTASGWLYHVGCIRGQHHLPVGVGTSWERAFNAAPIILVPSQFEQPAYTLAPASPGMGNAVICTSP